MCGGDSDGFCVFLHSVSLSVSSLSAFCVQIIKHCEKH